MASKNEGPCKRPYTLGKRLEQSDRKREQILAAARAQLESDGYLGLTLDSLARKSGVTRQTIHNIFGTKSGVIEALFDQLALNAGMERMRNVMQQPEPEAMLDGFIEVFTSFWKRDRLLLRRVHGIAAIDPELGAAVEARNARRRMAATRVVNITARRQGQSDATTLAQKAATLCALTSFEFFDALAEACGNPDEAATLVSAITRRAVAASL
jgi:AcrR family transcriptional regulator